MAERLILYYWGIESDAPQIFWYNFMIQNTKREINIAKTNLFSQLCPHEAPQTISSDLISNSRGMHYELLHILSSLPERDIDFSKIYQGKVKRDRRLNERVSEEGWQDFIKQILEGNI